MLLLSFSSTYRKLNLNKISLFSRILPGSSLPLLGEDDRKEFYLHSLSAIYEVFMAEQIGCKVIRLWNIGGIARQPLRGEAMQNNERADFKEKTF